MPSDPPTISRREWIRWIPDDPIAKEPTDTIVLTSTEKRFVDIRIFKDDDERTGVQPDGIRLLSQLDWAFAGTSSTSAPTPSETNQWETHSSWKHFVDSRHVDAEDVKDEGVMVPNREGKSVEKGRMVYPLTGKETEYEECWESVPAKSTRSMSAEADTRGKGKDEGGSEGPVENVVLVMQNDEFGERGMVVRVGQFCQGVVRCGEDRFALERWEWKGEEEGWKRTVRMGDVWLPCMVAMHTSKIQPGGMVKYEDHEWAVVELAEC